jgi:hypothetical protein
MREIGARRDVRLITIKQGSGLNRSGTFQQFGARAGVADILGWLFLPGAWALGSVPPNVRALLPDLGLGIPLAFEGKVGKDRLRPEQKSFLDMIRRFGGIAIEFRCVQDIVEVLP